MFGAVSEYILSHPEQSSLDVATHFNLPPQKVYAVRTTMKIRGMLKATEKKTEALDEKDVITVHNIGIEKVKRIIKLLEALK